MHWFVLLLLSAVVYGNTDDFYTLPANVKPGTHGELIRSVEIQTSVPNARAWKVLYWSTTILNDTIPVSGLVIAPKGTPRSNAKRPVVTWGHGTTGLARSCAPSLVDNPAQDAIFYYMPNSTESFDMGIPSLTKLIDKGYVVAATDYNGLGVAVGTHHYLIGSTLARNVLDAAIAAQELPDAAAGKKTIAFGWSEGGEAVIWAAEMADYGQDRMELVGAVALAPLNSIEQYKILQKKRASGETIRGMEIAEGLMGCYAMTFVYPELKLSDLLTPAGLSFFTAASKLQSAHHLNDSLTYMASYQGPIFRKDTTNQQAWLKRMEENSLGAKPTQIPIAVYQGEDDVAVFPMATQAYIDKAKSSGTQIEYKTYAGIDHIRLAAKAEADYLPWIAKCFSNRNR